MSLTAALGERTTIQCDVTDVSDYREESLIQGYGLEQMGPGSYVITRTIVARTNGSYDVEIDRTPTEAAWLKLREDGERIPLRNLYAKTVATIEVRTQYNPIFYAGLGLTWLLTAVLLGGPLAALMAFLLRRFRPAGPLLKKMDRALNETVLSEWLVLPWLFAVSVRAIANARPQTMLRAYVAADSLWNLYYLMAILIIPFRIIDIFHSQNRGWPAGGAEIAVAIILSIILCVALFAIRQVTFFSVVSPYWGPINMDNVEEARPEKWTNSLPFVSVALIGWIGLYSIANYYWAIWL